jgi:hypothetical protein
MKNVKSWTASIAFRKQVRLGAWTITAQMKNGDGAWGRLGGGWKWKLGILWGGTDVVLDLFVMSIRFVKDRAPK